MEVLNYSLWFILIWWAFMLYIEVQAKKKLKDIEISLLLYITFLPSIMAMLLEYLIMR